jgi:hypothetical protein
MLIGHRHRDFLKKAGRVPERRDDAVPRFVLINGDGAAPRAQRGAAAVVAALLPYTAGWEGSRYLLMPGSRRSIILTP